MDCLFCKIVAGEIPSETLYEGEDWIAFRDIHPQAPCHVLIVPRQHIASLWELTDPGMAGILLAAAADVARLEGLERGWRLIVNTREEGGQEVDHLHLHVLGGRRLGPMLSRTGG